MSNALDESATLRFALVAPDSVLESWRSEIEQAGLTAVTRFATRCDMILGTTQFEWVCVYPTVSDTGLMDLIADCHQTIVSKSLPPLKSIKTTFETNVTNRLSLAVEQIDEAIDILDASGRITYVNRAFENLTGYQAATVLGREPE